jgi:hypothetical protein
MTPSESLSFLRVIGDEDQEIESERRCLSSSNISTRNTNLIINLIRKSSRFIYGTFIAIVLIVCVIYFVLFNNFNKSSDTNQLVNNLKQKFINNVTNDNIDEIPLSPFEEAVMVETDCGKVIGAVEDGAFAFKVIINFIFAKNQFLWINILLNAL